jgi:hypothetical protein
MSVDITKPCVTGGSKMPVEIIKILEKPLGNGDTIIGVIHYSDGYQELASWRANGQFNPKDPNTRLDLVNEI